MDVQLELGPNGRGAFFITEDGKKIAEMVIGITGQDLTAYHTEVVPEAEGRGLAKALFSHLVEYVRERDMKVIPLCPYVLAQFRRHPEEFADIWKKNTIKA